jgi:preprotein translocase SecF subunit
LTIVGYSINDTIVVFDRIRENVKRMKRKDSFEIASISIDQTILRSIFTSLTTLLVIGSLFIYGTPAVKEFATPLLAGVLAGTYSSIFIASPVWAILKTNKG